MKNIFKLTVAGCALSLAAIGSAQADMLDEIYLRADAGMTVANKTTGQDYKGFEAKKFKKTPFFSIGVGYHLNENIRADVNLGYYSNFKVSKSLNGGKVKLSQKNKSMTAIANVSYDICDYNNFVPYVTVGAGFSRNKSGRATVNLQDTGKIEAAGKSKTNFAWNAGLGVRYKIQQDLSVDLGYKYNDLGKLETKKVYVTEGLKRGDTGKPLKSKLRAHAVTLGLIYKF